MIIWFSTPKWWSRWYNVKARKVFPDLKLLLKLCLYVSVKYSIWVTVWCPMICCVSPCFMICSFYHFGSDIVSTLFLWASGLLSAMFPFLYLWPRPRLWFSQLKTPTFIPVTMDVVLLSRSLCIKESPAINQVFLQFWWWSSLKQSQWKQSDDVHYIFLSSFKQLKCLFHDKLEVM